MAMFLGGSFLDGSILDMVVKLDIVTKQLKSLSAKNVFMGMVLFMWAISFIIDILNPKYDPPEYVNPLIMLVGGFLLAAANSSNKDNNEKE